ncbi:hypothetical protein [Blastomonas sp. CACIA14H2]|uniref:hypothetical protein n=1 Tax=Blastomonas sp. CACIA14H2 TaxID=1419876 RepID=UPI0004CFBF09
MRRVTLLLELVEDEAELVTSAVSATSVRFAGLTLEEILRMGTEGAASQGRDITLQHHAVSDGAQYQGGMRHTLMQLK